MDRLLRFLAVEGITGQEKAIGREVARALEEAGVPRKAIRFDRAGVPIGFAETSEVRTQPLCAR